MQSDTCFLQEKKKSNKIKTMKPPYNTYKYALFF